MSRKYTQRDRERAKQRSAPLKQRIGDERFTALPYNFLQSQALTNLSPSASKLLFQFIKQLGKNNNGDLQAAWSVLKNEGWNSPTTLQKAINELREAGVIILTRQGGRGICNLYALTFVAIDECEDKYGRRKITRQATSRPLGFWQEELKDRRDLIASNDNNLNEGAS